MINDKISWRQILISNQLTKHFICVTVTIQKPSLQLINVNFIASLAVNKLNANNIRSFDSSFTIST